MKQNTFSLFIILFVVCVSCEINFENNTRILVKGTLKDSQENALPDAEINVFTRRGNGFYSFGQTDYLLGRNYSTNEGVFEVTSLFDRDENFSVEINAGEGYSKYVYSLNTLNYTPENLLLDLGEKQIIQLATVNYSIEKISTDETTLEFFFEYKDTFCIEVYEDEILVPEQSNCYINNAFGSTLEGEEPNQDNLFTSLLGSSVSFTYSINDQEPITETFVITNTTYDFTFTY